MFFKHFMCTVYKPFHDECLKNISSITFISLNIEVVKQYKDLYTFRAVSVYKAPNNV